MKKRFETVFADLRSAYIWLYIAYIGIMECAPVAVWTEGASWPAWGYSALAIGGAILLFADLLSRRILFKTKNCGIAILFMVATVISIAVNMKYGVVDNLKTLVWSAIQIFLLAAVDTDLPQEENNRRFNGVMMALASLWNIGVLISMGMFCIYHQGVYYLQGYGKVVYEGFCESRLYGVFLDPNYAAMFAFVVLIFSVLSLCKKTAPVWCKVFHGVSVFLNFTYIVLSGSRTVEICLYLSILLVICWLVWNWLRGKWSTLLRLGASVLCAVVCVGVCFGVFRLEKKALSYIPAFYREAMQEQGKDPLHNFKPNHSADDDEKDHLEGIDMDRPDVVNNDDISNNRIAIWTDYIKALPKTSFFGTSPRNVISFMKDHFSEDLFVLQKGYGPHNAYLIAIVCTGYIGGAVAMLYLVLLVVEILSYLIRNRKQRGKTYFQVLLYTASLLMFAVCGMSYAIIFFNNMLVTLMFWLILGQIYAIIRYDDANYLKKRPLPYRLTELIYKKREKE